MKKKKKVLGLSVPYRHNVFPSDSTFYSCRVNVKLDDNNGPYNVGLVIKKEREKKKIPDSVGRGREAKK